MNTHHEGAKKKENQNEGIKNADKDERGVRCSCSRHLNEPDPSTEAKPTKVKLGVQLFLNGFDVRVCDLLAVFLLKFCLLLFNFLYYHSRTR